MSLTRTVKIFVMAAAILAGLATAPPAWSQSRTVKGRVLDETETPVAGAFVTVKNETRGVMTDGAGEFDISVKPSDILIVSFLGYE
ncbi:MAG: carboxypeptidase-like regulatory domain-containing protein, partial [Bacteroidales bacterium]|nr:carboxypeptidase-like regulatory domain-containing protein [Bacteroidales bacterium]